MLKIRSTYLYLAAALGLFCYIYFIDYQFQSTAQERRAAGNLFDFRADEVNHLEITNANGTTVIDKVGERWKIVKPVEAFPEAGVVQQILGELEFARSERIIRYDSIPGLKEETIKQWNLNPAAVRVAFSTPKRAYVLLIGRNVGATEAFYARASVKPDAPIYVIGSATRQIVDRNLVDLRSRAVYDFDSALIDRASVREFTSGSLVAHDVELVRNKDNAWSLHKPLVARADKARVSDWLKQVQDLRVIQFVSDESSNLSTYGLSSPVSQITVQTQGQAEELSLIVGTSPQDKPDEVYAKRQRGSSVFTVSKQAIAKLLAGLPQCRDKKLHSMSSAQVSAVAIEQKGKTIAVEKKEGVWRLVSEGDLRAEAGRVQDFINSFVAVQSTQFVKDAATDLRPYGLDKPSIKVALRGAKDREIDSVDVLFGKADGKQIYATTSAEPFIYSMPLGVLDLVPKEALFWRDLQVLRVEPDKVKELSITGKEGINTLLIRQAKEVFSTRAQGKAVDGPRAEAQLGIISQLRATQWLGKPLAIYALEKPVMQIELTTLEGKTLIRVGATLLSGGRAAQVDGQPHVFEMSLADYSALEQSALANRVVQPAQPVTPLTWPINK